MARFILTLAGVRVHAGPDTWIGHGGPDNPAKMGYWHRYNDTLASVIGVDGKPVGYEALRFLRVVSDTGSGCVSHVPLAAFVKLPADLDLFPLYSAIRHTGSTWTYRVLGLEKEPTLAGAPAIGTPAETSSTIPVQPSMAYDGTASPIPLALPSSETAVNAINGPLALATVGIRTTEYTEVYIRRTVKGRRKYFPLTAAELDTAIDDGTPLYCKRGAGHSTVYFPVDSDGNPIKD